MSQTPPENMQPIATAPTNGTRIKAWRPGYGLYSVQWKDGMWTVREGKTVPANEVTLWREPPPPPPMPSPVPQIPLAREVQILLDAADELDEGEEY